MGDAFHFLHPKTHRIYCGYKVNVRDSEDASVPLYQRRALEQAMAGGRRNSFCMPYGEIIYRVGMSVCLSMHLQLNMLVCLGGACARCLNNIKIVVYAWNSQKLFHEFHRNYWMILVRCRGGNRPIEWIEWPLSLNGTFHRKSLIVSPIHRWRFNLRLNCERTPTHLSARIDRIVCSSSVNLIISFSVAKSRMFCSIFNDLRKQ